MGDNEDTYDEPQNQDFAYKLLPRKFISADQVTQMGMFDFTQYGDKIEDSIKRRTSDNSLHVSKPRESEH